MLRNKGANSRNLVLLVVSGLCEQQMNPTPLCFLEDGLGECCSPIAFRTHLGEPDGQAATIVAIISPGILREGNNPQ